MDQQDEFKTWIKAVEEALSGEIKAIEKPSGTNNCGCGSWNCAICFPDDKDDEFTFGTGNIPSSINDIEADNMMGLEEVGMEEEDNTFVEKPKSGKGVKLGDIVQKTEFKKVGKDSPMTYGDENLDEEEFGIFDETDEFDHVGDEGNDEFSTDDTNPEIPPGISTSDQPEDNFHQDSPQDMISLIGWMQLSGLSKAPRNYNKLELGNIADPDEIKKIYDQVLGNVAEADKPVKTPTNLDDFDDTDIFSTQPDNLPTAPDDETDDISGDDNTIDLPTASRVDTQRLTRDIPQGGVMGDYSRRINPMAGGAEPELPPRNQNEIAPRANNDLPARIGNMLTQAGMVNPLWHRISDLPGYQEQPIRGMGRNIFGMMTRTPLEDIKTIANVMNHGPNTDRELNAIAQWVRDNAEDLGPVVVGHGMAIPGYNPQARSYRAGGVIFHIVRDPMGKYIYAWPAADSITAAGQELQGQLGGDGNIPRLRESRKGQGMKKFTLFEQLKWDDEIREALKELALTESQELEESTLSRLIGKQQGGQNLVRWLHKRHKLSNEAELEPVKFNKGLLWTQFKKNPDDFVIVSGERGVAGVKPSQKYIEDMTKQMAASGKIYNPGGDSNVPYQIIAFTDDGEQVDPELFHAQPGPGEEPEERHPDPTVIKARMGRNIGNDLQNQNNTFRLLNDQIGPIRTVWISGFAGYRGEPGTIKPAVGSVERGKIANRAELKKPSPSLPPDQAKDKIFKRLIPILEPIVNKAFNEVVQELNVASRANNEKMEEKLFAAKKILNEFKRTIDTTGDIPTTGIVNTILTRVLKKVTRMEPTITIGTGRQAQFNQPNPAYGEAISEIAQGNATKLFPVVEALRDILIGLE